MCSAASSIMLLLCYYLDAMTTQYAAMVLNTMTKLAAKSVHLTTFLSKTCHCVDQKAICHPGFLTKRQCYV